MAEHGGEFLAVAERIGRRIYREAIWHSGACNWVGAEPLERLDGTNAQGPLTYRALTADLYSGTTGVALFLAELHAATGDLDARRTALGAIRQALSQLDGIAPNVRLGLFTGWSGIAYAAARLGTVF